MAIWYTDYAFGNDTTGDGTSSLPFKTIQKAVSLASNDDTIRVAGSSWTSVSGTVTAPSTTSTTLNTSVDLTGQLTAGVSLISFKDPQLGDRKLIFKVTGVTSTTITVHVATGITPGINYEIEKLSGLYYTTGSTGTIFENLTGTSTTLTGIKIEGGWTSSFTAQDGITAMQYTAASTATGATGISMASGQTGWSINNFCFVALSFGAGITSSGFDMALGLGNIWLTNCRIFSSNFSMRPVNIPGTPMNLYSTTSATMLLVGSSIGIGVEPFTIDNLYVLDNGSSSWGISLANKTCMTVNNMYVKEYGTSPIGNASGGQLYSGSYIINNLTVAWWTDATSSNYILFGDSAAGKLINLTGLGNLTSKAFGLAQGGSTQAQWINTSINIDDYTWLGNTSYTSSPGYCTSYVSAKDSEGDKLLQGGTIPVYADSTVFDTGTNSLRIKRSNTQSYSSAVPIKQYYIPTGTTGDITFTIRAKSTAANTTGFGLLATAGISEGVATGEPYVERQNFSLTNAWADYTYTLPSTLVIEAAGGYVILACITEEQWTEQHVWIDSVTIS